MGADTDPVFGAVAALRSRGHTVEPLDTYPPSWLVDGGALTDWEVVTRALDLGLMDTPRAVSVARRHA